MEVIQGAVHRAEQFANEYPTEEVEICFRQKISTENNLIKRKFCLHHQIQKLKVDQCFRCIEKN